jgi:hypothetical protein
MGKRERRRRREHAAAALAPVLPAPFRTAVGVDKLHELVGLKCQVERQIDQEIDRLHEAGVGWPPIAAALGVSRQAARERALRMRR